MNQKEALSKKDNDYSLLEKKYLKLTKSELLDPFSTPPAIKLDKNMTASIVIPGKNVESSILSCLVSIEQSSFNIKYPNKLQIIFIDDGSDDKTLEIIKNNKYSLNLVVIKQKHAGQAQALNTGISVAQNEIIISCDADMILSYYTIEQLMIRHQLFPNILLAGFRSEVSKDDPRVNPVNIRRFGLHKYPTLLTDERIAFSSSGHPNNMCLASNHFKDLGNLNGLWMRNNDDPWLLSDLVFGALFSLPKKTYYQIGGYDERLIGYGCTDGYLVSKAISVGKFVLPVYSATGLHISHSSRTGNKRNEYLSNRRLFYKLIETSQTNDYINWLDKSKNRIIEQINKKPSSKILPKSKNANNILPKHLNIDTLLAVGQYRKITDRINNLEKTDTSKDTSYWNQTPEFYIKQGTLFYEQEFYEIALRCFEIALAKEDSNKIALKYHNRCLKKI
ncbi:MAG: glycosyltransferase family 2 protein [bacterium]|nr:MAG: glycosyltransferase family 2 protein [bacterium]